MFKIGDKIVYKKEVCEIIEIKKNYINNNDYFVLIPIFDKSLKIEIPVSNSNLRSLISKEEIEDIIKQIPNIDILESDNKLIENEYKSLMNSGKCLDLIKIIKTTYLRNQERLPNKKKIGDKDSSYFCQAEKCLYQEFGIVLEMSYENTKNYIIEEVNKIYDPEVK